MEMTNSETLGLVFDTGHWALAAAILLPTLKHSPIGSGWCISQDHDPGVAAKSRQFGWDGPASVGQGIFPELGKGDVDFPGVLRKLDEISYQGWIVVEQDVLPGLGTPLESATRNRNYLRQIGL